jgi:hypothetical protein
VPSQKFTRPGVTAVLPDTTVAVNVTTAPAPTLVTALPPEVTASVVVVAAPVAQARLEQVKTLIGRVKNTKKERRTVADMGLSIPSVLARACRVHLGAKPAFRQTTPDRF